MTTSAPAKSTLQTIVLVLAVFLSITAIVELFSGASSVTNWLAAICWPIVVLATLVSLFRRR